MCRAFGGKGNGIPSLFSINFVADCILTKLQPKLVLNNFITTVFSPLFTAETVAPVGIIFPRSWNFRHTACR